MKEEITRQFEQFLEVRQINSNQDKLANACTDFFGNWQGNPDILF